MQKKKVKISNFDDINKNETMKKTLIVFLFLIIVISLIIFFFTSSHFSLNEIIVKNNLKMTKDEVEKLSEFKKGKNVFLQNYFKANSNFKNSQRIDKYNIKLKFPNKIEIDVTERVEAYQISLQDGYYIIDKFGYLIRKVDSKQSILLIENLESDFKKDKKRIEEKDFFKLEEINEIYFMAKALNFESFISKIIYKDNDIIMEFASENKKAHIKSIKDLRNTLSLVKAILEAEKNKKGEIFADPDNEIFFRELAK